MLDSSHVDYEKTESSMAAMARSSGNYSGSHMDRLLSSLRVPNDFSRYDVLAVLASAGQWLLGAPRRDQFGRAWTNPMETGDWQAAMTLLRLYNSIDNER